MNIDRENGAWGGVRRITPIPFLFPLNAVRSAYECDEQPRR